MGAQSRVLAAAGAVATAALVAVAVLVGPSVPGEGESAGLASPPPPELPVRLEDPEPEAAPREPSEPRATLDPYEGKYSGDANFRARMDRFVDAVPGAVAQIRKNLRLGDAGAPRIRVRFVDTGSARRGFVARVNRSPGPAGGEQVMTVVAEDLAAGCFDPRRLVLHEVAHCWQGHLLGERMDSMPRWLVEGLADWVSLEGEEERIRTFCSIQFSSMEDMKEVLERWHGEFLRKRTETYSGYAYAQLAVRFLRLLHPPGDGDAFLHRLFVGEGGLSWEEELFRSTGLKFPGFAARLRPWAEAQVLGFLRNRDEFLGARELQARDQWKAAAAAFEEFVGRHPADVFAPRAMFETAVCRYKAGSFSESLRWLDALSKEWPQSELDSSIAMYRFLNAYERASCLPEEREGACALGIAFLRDFSYLPSEHLEPIRRKLTHLER